ncbi:MAG: hypothetical protein KDA95_02125 [Acidimicrobiales bacterium]|nr:hypothetical protein [Acidimicrobiales bacterium]
MTTAKATTTTVAATTDPEKADDAVTKASLALVFEEGAFPDGWTVSKPAEPYTTKGIAIDDCFNPEGGLLAQQPLGSAAAGPTMKMGEVPFFISTWAVTFTSEDDAKTWAKSMTDAESIECRRSALEGNNDFEVRQLEVDPTSGRVGEDGREAVINFEFVENGVVGATMRVDVYRKGASVLTVTMQLGGMTQEQADAGTAVEAELRGLVLGS